MSLVIVAAAPDATTGAAWTAVLEAAGVEVRLLGGETRWGGSLVPRGAACVLAVLDRDVGRARRLLADLQSETQAASHNDGED